MTEVTNHIFDTIDRQNAHESAHTRRTLIKTTAAAMGSMGLLGLTASEAGAQDEPSVNSVENLAAVAATAEVLAKRTGRGCSHAVRSAARSRAWRSSPATTIAGRPSAAAL